MKPRKITNFHLRMKTLKLLPQPLENGSQHQTKHTLTANGQCQIDILGILGIYIRIIKLTKVIAIIKRM